MNRISDEHFTCNFSELCKFLLYARAVYRCATAMFNHIIDNHKITKNAEPKTARIQKSTQLCVQTNRAKKNRCITRLGRIFTTVDVANTVSATVRPLNTMRTLAQSEATLALVDLREK
jgi:hypothetical protein